MLNENFSEATRSVAFNLSLSKVQCNTLLRLKSFVTKTGGCDGLTIGSLQGLLRRGLVFWHQDENGRPCGFGGLTPEGSLVVELIEAAGITIDGTMTPAIIRRFEREGVES